MKCADCGMHIGVLDHGAILRWELIVGSESAKGEVRLCDTCDDVLYFPDIIGAIPAAIVSELRKARQPCAVTRLLPKEPKEECEGCHGKGGESDPCNSCQWYSCDRCGGTGFEPDKEPDGGS